MKNEQTKLCKHCQTEIPKKAKVCPQCRKKQGGIGKWIIISIVVFIIIGALGSTSSSDDNSNDNNSSNTQTNISVLTAEKFNSIDFGMSYEDVVEIIGEEGDPVSEATVSDITTAIYQWSDGLANFNITLTNNELTGKAQYGIITSSTEVTLDMYNSIETGMTYDEVVGIFGGDGAFLSNSKVFDSVTEIYVWNGTSLGANCNITFQDGKVFAKAQFELE